MDGDADVGRDVRAGRDVGSDIGGAAGTGLRGFASAAQSGHQDERRRSRPGRWRCSSGVATNTCPASQSQHRYTSAAGGIWLSTIPALYSGRYCRTSTGYEAHASRYVPTGYGTSAPRENRRRSHHRPIASATPAR